MTESTERPAWQSALACGLLAAGIVLLIQYAYVRGQGGNWAALVRVGERSWARPIIEAELGPVPLVEDVGHDGQTMYLMARYLFHAEERGILAERLDHVEYRARRVGYPALAGGLGSFSPELTLAGMVFWCAAGAFLYGVSIGLLGAQWRLSALVQCIALLNPGLISAGLILGCDALALGLAMLAVALWLRDGRRWALVLLALAALTKDSFILFAVVLALVELRQSGWRWALALVLAPGIPLALWSGYVHLLFQESVAQGAFNFAFIGVGLVRAYPVWQQLVGEQVIQLYLALGMLGLGIVALGLARQPVILGMLAVFVALGLITSESVWQMPNNAVRVLAPLWTFGFMAIGERWRG